MRISDWSSDVCSSDLAAIDREYGGREPDQPRGHLAVERGKPLEAPVEAVEEGTERSRQGDRRSDGKGGNRCQSQAASRFRCGSTIIQRRRCGASPLDHALPQSSCSLCLCCRIATAAGGCIWSVTPLGIRVSRLGK